MDCRSGAVPPKRLMVEMAVLREYTVMPLTLVPTVLGGEQIVPTLARPRMPPVNSWLVMAWPTHESAISVMEDIWLR